MIKTGQQQKTTLLRQLYSYLIIHNTEAMSKPRNLADVAFEDCNSQGARETLASLCQIDNEGRATAEYGGIFYSNNKGRVYCQKNENKGNKSYQEIYEVSKISLDHRLHILAVERERNIIQNRIDIGVYITDSENLPIYSGSTSYETFDRFTYLPLAKQISKRTQQELDEKIPYKNRNSEELVRFMHLQNMAIVSAILCMDINLLKSIKD